MARGIQRKAEELLRATNVMGGYPMSLVCTDQGLVVASDGDATSDDDMAAFTSLFDDIVQRAKRDLGFSEVDEVTLLDPAADRTVIRPLPIVAETRLFLVVRVPVKLTWRRNTNALCKKLVVVLRELVADGSTDDSEAA